MSEAATVLALALDADAGPPSDRISGRVLDAALALVAGSGARHVTMDDVARRAGVGRMTVYRRFGDRARLLEALTVRETRRCLAELDAAASPDDPIADQLAAGLVTALRLAREHPLLARLARTEPETVVATLTAERGAVFALARAFLAERLRAARRAGVVGDIPLEPAAEVLVRLVVSFVLVEDTVLPVGDDERLGALARTLLAPMLTGGQG